MSCGDKSDRMVLNQLMAGGMDMQETMQVTVAEMRHRRILKLTVRLLDEETVEGGAEE